MSNFRMVFDVGPVESRAGGVKQRYAWYASLDEAVMQAEHEHGHPDAQKRMRAALGPSGADAELHPSGVRVLRIEDAKGKVVWEPPKRPKYPSAK